MKLHLGCGSRRFEGYVNIDMKGGDVECDIRTLPYLDEVVEEIVAIHVAEHFFITELLAVLTEWHRVLKTDGKLVLELPCWDKVRKLIAANAPENLTRWALYGEPRTHIDGVPALHKWCWSAAEIEGLLQDVGFVNVKQETPLFHQPIRDMRWVATK